MFLNDEGPIAGGRELWGFPKKLGQPTLRTELDTLIGTLDYGPLRVATGTMGYKHRDADLAQVKAALEEPNFLLKIIPHVDGSPRICELVEYHLEQLVLKGAWTGPASLALTPHALAPVADLPVLEIVSAIHIRADLTLGLGKVVHDYLQQPVQRPLRSFRESGGVSGRPRSARRAKSPSASSRRPSQIDRKGEMDILKGKVAVVTGSTSGIGLAYARAFAGAGANIVLNGMGHRPMSKKRGLQSKTILA